MNKKDLLHVISEYLSPSMSMEESSSYTEQGFMKFIGNQYNTEWEWNEDGLKSLDNEQLLSIIEKYDPFLLHMVENTPDKDGDDATVKVRSHYDEEELFHIGLDKWFNANKGKEIEMESFSDDLWIGGFFHGDKVVITKCGLYIPSRIFEW
jgi:hypothetical protein